MPKRKNRTADKSQKKQKVNQNDATAPDSNKIALFWEQKKDQKWIPFSSTHIDILNECIEKDEKGITLDNPENGDKVIVDTSKMTWKDISTGKQNQVRCFVDDNSDNSRSTWQWIDNRCWNPYTYSIVIELEKAFKNDIKTVSCSKEGKTVSLDLSKMKEKDETTNKLRSIKRIQSQISISSTKDDLAIQNVKNARKQNVKDPKKQDGNQRKKNTKTEPVLSSGKKVSVNTNIAIDSECVEKIGKAHVYCENDDNVYNAVLNQTNVQNNNNKYYLLQLFKDNNSETFSVWFHWGRVGKKGQTSLQNFGQNLEAAKSCFEKKFQEKTVNKWENRNNFVKKDGKYDLLKMDYDTEKESEPQPATLKETKPKKAVESKLDKNVQVVLKMIFDYKELENTVTEMKFDAKKNPLGKLTLEQINAGYLALKKIEKFIQDNNLNEDFVRACNEFYTRIPHDFGMKRPPLIQTLPDIKEKVELLEALGGIEIALKIMNESSLKSMLHPLDFKYEQLNCQLNPLEASDKEYEVIKQYVQNTHGGTHAYYSLSVLNVFKCIKEGEEEKFCDYGNRMLLWHGSRLSNWAGILKQGLRIAPPEAPVTGYMFGKGIYFADMVSKSANYCHATKEGLLVLCEVSLGKCNELKQSDYRADKLPKNKNSVKGLGMTTPDPKMIISLQDGVKVPLGKPVKAELHNREQYSLLYNEYIVYNRDQVKMRYLVHCKFDYKIL